MVPRGAARTWPLAGFLLTKRVGKDETGGQGRGWAWRPRARWGSAPRWVTARKDGGTRARASGRGGACRPLCVIQLVNCPGPRGVIIYDTAHGRLPRTGAGRAPCGPDGKRNCNFLLRSLGHTPGVPARGGHGLMDAVFHLSASRGGGRLCAVLSPPPPPAAPLDPALNPSSPVIRAQR